MVLWILQSLTEKLFSRALKNMSSRTQKRLPSCGKSWAASNNVFCKPSQVLLPAGLKHMLRDLPNMNSLIVKCLAILGLVASWFMWESLEGPTSPKPVRTKPAGAQIIFALLVVGAKVFKDASIIHASPRHLESALRKTRSWSAQIPDFHAYNLPISRVHAVWTVGSELFLMWPQSPCASLGQWLLACGDSPTNNSSSLKSVATGNLTSRCFASQPCVETSSQHCALGTGQAETHPRTGSTSECG